MTQEVGLLDVYAQIEGAFKKSDIERVEALLMPAVDQFSHDSRLWFYTGCLLYKQGSIALASVAFQRAIDLDDAPHIYSNLGACYRRLNLREQGLTVLHRCLEKNGEYAPALVNIGSMYVNEGNPEGGIHYLERAVKIGTERGAEWNLGLLYLESCRFAEGFDLYRKGVANERALRCYGSVDQTQAEPVLLTPELFHVERGKKKSLIVWGEQGIGDELMFGTVIEDARKEWDLSFECHPRLQKLHHNAHPHLPLYPTRKDEWISWPVTEKKTFDFKCPLGDLASYYRRDLQSFKTAWASNPGTYHANPVEVSRYRDQLTELARGRPIVGLATRGGVMSTARYYRVVSQKEIDRLMTETDALYVALDYDDMLGVASHVEETYGPDRYRWFPSIVQHWDYDHTAALVAACDLTVTVCQSVFHLSAAMGHPTRCLTPKRCAWRYASVPGEPELSYWYPDPDIRLYRQEDPESWKHPLDRVIADINALALVSEEVPAEVVKMTLKPGAGAIAGRGPK